MPSYQHTSERPPWGARRVVRAFVRYGLVALIDCFAVFATYMFAAGVRTGGRPTEHDLGGAAVLALTAGVFQVVANMAFAVYWRAWAVAALEDLVALVKATSLAFMAILLIDLALEPRPIPLAALLTGAGLVLVVESALKLQPRWRQIIRAAIGRNGSGECLIIVGAGRTGQLLARDLLQHVDEYRIACFMDDDPATWGTYVRGIRVQGSIDGLGDSIQRHGATLVVIAIAHPTGSLVRRVVGQCDGTNARVRAVAGVAIPSSDTRALRVLSIEELLEREPVDLQVPDALQFIRGKRVVVTGAAGSIGSELARQVATLGPAHLVLLDINESGLHDLRLSLGSPGPRIETLLLDMRDAVDLRRAFAAERPEVVFHVGAYKHVPLLESAPGQAIRTNVVGTQSVLAAASEAGVPSFVFVSSDKAVEPASVLGHTKRLGELLTLAYAKANGATYCVVRFGNVLGSVGSVVPIFERQIDRGGPVTVTHPQATRYFMTIPEASGLVIIAGATARGGDLLVLDMGAPLLVADLARKMIRLRGLRTPTDVDLAYVGLRPGEKLHEALLFPYETAQATPHPRTMRVLSRAPIPTLAMLRPVVEVLERLVDEGQDKAAVDLLRRSTDPWILTSAPLVEIRPAVSESGRALEGTPGAEEAH